MLWRCPHGHILGRVLENPPRLLLYRQAVERDVDGASPVIAAIIGDRATVTCSLCGSAMTWHADASTPDREYSPFPPGMEFKSPLTSSSDGGQVHGESKTDGH